MQDGKSNKKMIVHISTDEKFLVGYVNFMKKYMQDYQHAFIIESNRSIEFDNNEDVYFVASIRNIYGNKELYGLLQNADKIIISGLFSINLYYSMMPKKIFNKTYIHLWGGDFYCLREKKPGFSEWLDRTTRLRCIKRCAGIIMLIEKEYETFLEICGIDKLNFIAEMPMDIEDITVCLDESLQLPMCVDKEKINVLVGNSATEENLHLEVFELLHDYANEEYELYVPLSYGNDTYKEIVLKKGQELFGEHFHPLLEYMPETTYINLLNAMDIGIFNNNRQQATRNIEIMLQLGKTLYMRNDTTMYAFYTKRGITLHNVADIQSEHGLKVISDEQQQKNVIVVEDIQSVSHRIEQWKQVLAYY